MKIKIMKRGKSKMRSKRRTQLPACLRRTLCLAAAVCIAALALSSARARAQQPATLKIEAPEITGIQEWINSKPLKLKDLRGKVVVLHFWTFG
jgi:hypothetical protein